MKTTNTSSKTLTKVDNIKKAEFIKNYRAPEIMGNISVVCSTIGIARQTYYDWLEADEIFRNIIAEAKLEMCDVAEAELYSRGLEKDTTALIYWLKNRHPDFKEEPKILQQFNVGTKDGNSIMFVNFKNDTTS